MSKSRSGWTVFLIASALVVGSLTATLRADVDSTKSPSETRGDARSDANSAASSSKARQNPAPRPAPPETVSPSPDNGALPNLGGLFPGLGELLRPDGFALPGGMGFIRRAPDRFGVQINTPDGPFEITIPRRQQPVQPPENIDEPPTPRDENNAFPPAARAPSLGPSIDDNGGPAENAGRTGRAAREFAIASRAFRAGHYPVALRRVSRWLERDPANRDLLQLRALVNFTLRDYVTAYHDALTVLAEEDIWDWATLRSLYRSSEEYTGQYRALEDQALTHPQAVELRFLLAYHNLMLGHRDVARRQFEQVAVLEPRNAIARRLSAAQRPPQPRQEAPKASSTPSPSSKAPNAPGSPQPPVKTPTARGPFSIELGPPAQIPPAK